MDCVPVFDLACTTMDYFFGLPCLINTAFGSKTFVSQGTTWQYVPFKCGPESDLIPVIYNH